MDDDSFSGGIDINFFGPCDVQISEVALELLIGGFQVKEGLQIDDSSLDPAAEFLA